jgi:hypothetical protein
MFNPVLQVEALHMLTNWEVAGGTKKAAILSLFRFTGTFLQSKRLLKKD